INGLIPGDYLYVAVKGQEDVKHVGVRVLPYTEDELRVLIKACILAKLYEKSVKPFDLQAPEDIDGDGHLDVYEDLDGDGQLDPGEDVDGDGRLDLVNEDRDTDGTLDTHVDAWGPFPYVVPAHALNQLDIAASDPFTNQGRFCDFDSGKMIITFGGVEYKIKLGGVAFAAAAFPARAYEQNNGMGVRFVKTSHLSTPGSRKGSNTLFYREATDGCQVAPTQNALYDYVDVAALIVHEQVHVFQIDKHASQPAYDLATYAGPWSNFHHLHDGLLADPSSAAPYVANDISHSLFGVDYLRWSPTQWSTFNALVLGNQYYKYLAYRYLPTEIQAYTVQYDAEAYFPTVQTQMQAEFATIWQGIFP
ncbi:MAG: hypothetical protein ACYTKD_14960, partial [Planctomycetota bacterium]